MNPTDRVATSALQRADSGLPTSVGKFARAQKWFLLTTLALVVALYARNFAMLFSDWSEDSNYSHGYLVPLAFVWMLWQKSGRLAQTQVRPSAWGLLLVVLGIGQLLVGRLGAENFVAHSSLVILIAGVTLYLFGASVFRQVLFPIGWLLFMIPLPALIFYSITFPLQLLASSLASGLLDLLSVPNLKVGNILYLPNLTVGVAEACSGIQSLISLIAFAALLGYFLSLGILRRWILALAAVPVALCVNALRVAGAALSGNYGGPRWAEGFFHIFSGWLLFVGALVVMFGLAQLLARRRRYSLRGGGEQEV